MSAEIETFADGRAAFMSARTPAWHKLGTVTEEAQTASDALRIACLNDWDVSCFPVYAYIEEDEDKNVMPIEGKYATCRISPETHERQPIDVVGSRYTPIQNEEAFALLDDIVAESGAHFETAGSLYGGRQVFVSMKLPRYIEYGDGSDTIDLYLLAWNSHDGSSSMKLAVTPMRVVCANTLRVGLRQAKSSFSIRHTNSANRRLTEARNALGLTFKYADAMEDEINKMLAATFTEAQYRAVVEKMVPTAGDDASDIQERRVDEQRASLRALWNDENQDSIRDTAWGAYNAVAEWVDWYSPARGDTDTARALRVLNGQADRAKNDAYKVIREIARV